MHIKGNNKQYEETMHRMGKKDIQGINLHIIQTADVAQYQSIKTQSTNGQKIYIDISPKKIYRWLTNTQKESQHHLLLEKRKSKLQ